MAADGSVDCSRVLSVPGPGACHDRRSARGGPARRADRVGARPPAGHGRPRRAGTGTFASRGAIAQGGAVDGAARTVRAELLALAAAALEASPRRPRAARRSGDACAACPGAACRWPSSRGSRTRRRRARAPMRGRWKPRRSSTRPGPRSRAPSTWRPSRSIRRRAGSRCARYALVEDCGPVINPLIVEGQIHGAVAQGIGEALGERLVYDEDGQLLTGTLMDYALPVAAALPDFAVGHLETPSPHHAGRLQGDGRGGHHRRARRHRQCRRRRGPAARHRNHGAADSSRNAPAARASSPMIDQPATGPADRRASRR